MSQNHLDKCLRAGGLSKTREAQGLFDLEWGSEDGLWAKEKSPSHSVGFSLSRAGGVLSRTP